MVALNATSYAKLNLFLRVIGKDSRGYHLLESFFALLNIGDDISLEKSKTLTCNMSGANILEENIALKTFQEISKYRKLPDNVKININKKIPIAAGMGGGSSNAAYVIKLINQLYKLQLSQNEIHEIASNIGADVPFFIHGKNAFVQGIGDQITPLKLGISLPVLVLYPDIHISTKIVYSQSVKSFSPVLKSLDKKIILDEIYYGKNDLIDAAITIAPELKWVIGLISKQKGCITARMSGSGSTCFGIFSDMSEVQAAYNNIKNKHPTFWLHKQLLQL